MLGARRRHIGRYRGARLSPARTDQSRARSSGFDQLTQSRLTVPTDGGANAGGKVMALVAGMLAGADSIDDMYVLRHGGMGRLFDRTYAPLTLGSFLREFRVGHVRQLDAVASRTLVNLASAAPLLEVANGERVVVDLDDTIIEVHGYQKQGASFGYSGVRGLNALIATASTTSSAPVILGQRLRQGKTGSPKGAARIVGDALATIRRMRPGSSPRPLLRADSAFYGHATVGTAIKAGADVSVTVRMDPAAKAAIATIGEDAWETIEYRTRSATSPGGGSPKPRSPTCRSPRSARGRRQIESRAGSWSGASLT